MVIISHVPTRVSCSNRDLVITFFIDESACLSRVECLLRITPYFFHDGVKMSTYCVGGSQRQGKDAVLRCFAGYYKQLRCFFFAMLVRRARDMTCEGEGVFEILLDIMISRRSCF